jgi:hypothetical protein
VEPGSARASSIAAVNLSLKVASKEIRVSILFVRTPEVSGSLYKRRPADRQYLELGCNLDQSPCDALGQPFSNPARDAVSKLLGTGAVERGRAVPWTRQPLSLTHRNPDLLLLQVQLRHERCHLLVLKFFPVIGQQLRTGRLDSRQTQVKPRG